ncbi:MAG: serine/threonine-protein kinase [Phycisphaerales bacterium]
MSGPDVPSQRRMLTSEIFGYRIRKWLGDGAFSRVYLVEDTKTHIAYAMKHVLSEGEKDDRWVDQIRAEWEIGRQLKHEAIRQLVDLKFEGSILKGIFLKNARDVGLVMELIDAVPLSEQAKPSFPECMRIFTAVASGLVHMHQKGFVHADMKPNNILYTDDRRTKVIDLGQAVKIGTVKERIQGTPGFIAPEQAKREPITEQTDVFNFGATMYWILMRSYAPQSAKHTNDSKVAVAPNLVGPSGPVHLVDPSIPEALSMLLLDCLEDLPHKRKKMTWVLKQLTALQQSKVGAGA